ncbi:MAG: tetratricopeptide repeat protein [Phycisphaerales bacterium]
MAHARSMLISRSTASAAFLIVLLAAGVPQAKSKKDAEWLAELNRMESQAGDARKTYWAGNYEQAQRQFAELTTSVHPSSILYLNECAMCSLTQGRYSEAEEYLRQVDSLLNTYYSEAREKRAVSAFGAEAEKIYRGDPYEQATAYMLLAMLLMDRGDYDNALAACKSGILADSDASENLFDSDITFLHVLEAKCYHLRGEQEAFRARREAAVKSARLTSAQVRDDFSKRQDLLALLKMSRAERKRLGDKRTDKQIQEEIETLNDDLDRRIEAIDAASQLGPLYSGEYNLLILVPHGRSARKIRTGAESEMIVFDAYQAQCQPPDLSLDGQPLQGSVSAAAVDVDFQAVTRGGRRMDAILKGKAVSRTTTREVGQNLVDVGSNVGGAVGLGVVLVGGIMQATAGAMTAEADTRCWQTLPKSFDVYALKVSPGTYDLTGSHYVYFQKSGEFRRTLKLEDDRGLAVAFVPPAAYGSYSRRTDMKLTERDRQAAGSEVLVVPPPTDLDDVIRIDVLSSEEKPEAIAPDPRRLMRSIRETLTAANLANTLVTHDEVMESHQSLSQTHRRALQCSFAGLAKEGTRKSGVYRTKLLFSLVEMASGRVLLSRTVEGTSSNVAAGASTAFYEGVKNATETLVQDPEFKRLCDM